jgi:hypothetical protein
MIGAEEIFCGHKIEVDGENVDVLMKLLEGVYASVTRTQTCSCDLVVV